MSMTIFFSQQGYLPTYILNNVNCFYCSSDSRTALSGRNSSSLSDIWWPCWTLPSFLSKQWNYGILPFSNIGHFQIEWENRLLDCSSCVSHFTLKVIHLREDANSSLWHQERLNFWEYRVFFAGTNMFLFFKCLLFTLWFEWFLTPISG